MYVKISDTDYTEIKNLSFAPDIGLFSDSLPINEFSVEIKTDDTIALGENAKLFDDNDGLWADYYIYQAYKMADGFIRVIARSVIFMMDRGIVDQEMYENEPVTNILTALFWGLPLSYTLDSALSSETISGFMPMQTRRERLQQVCFVIGAYVDTVFTGNVLIKQIGASYNVVPQSETYWRPEVQSKDLVTAIRITAYTFTEGTPQVTDDWLSDGSSGTGYYIETTQEFTLRNTGVPSGTPDNEVVIDNIKIVNTSNATTILSRLADIYFNRTTLIADILNDRQYKPGQKIGVSFSEDEDVTGYIQTAVFRYGTRAKSNIKLVGTENLSSGKLTVLYKYNGMQVRKDVYRFPVGYSYTIQTIWVDINLNKHRYVFRPPVSQITGTMTVENQTETLNVVPALDFYQNNLHIMAGDDITGGEVLEIE